MVQKWRISGIKPKFLPGDGLFGRHDPFKRKQAALDAALESVPELQLVAEATPAGEYADGDRMARQNSVVPLVERLGEESVERDRRWQEARVASHEGQQTLVRGCATKIGPTYKKSTI